MEGKKIPFPQANDFEKILTIITTDAESNIKSNELLIQKLKVTKRQINYYLSACVFLGILNNKREFTTYGVSLRHLNRDGLICALCMKIVSLPVFGDVFFSQYLFKYKFSNEEISELIAAMYDVDNVGVADRRASTVKNWVKWIESKRFSK